MQKIIHNLHYQMLHFLLNISAKALDGGVRAYQPVPPSGEHKCKFGNVTPRSKHSLPATDADENFITHRRSQLNFI